ncbi:MAG: zinc ribbon domain-containing protein [Nitriliruptorales bacterium]|nr:zinc ribbon domain-containing protein [Nitriliruptorales bacterium]
MTVYEYLCRECGVFEVDRPMGTAVPEVPCPRCARNARRRFCPPLLSRAPSALAVAHAREEKSRDEPEVVDRVPPRPAHRGGRPPGHPALKRLPKW